MKALLLEDVAKFGIREMPAPTIGPRDVMIRVGAVGICGTDLHIFHGFANYNRDERGQPIPLRQDPRSSATSFAAP